MKQITPPALQYLDDALAELKRRTLFRERPVPRTGNELSFCSNDYLGLAGRAAPNRPAGAGASRLVTGERAEHVEVEASAAELVGLPAALAFTSGYAANVGVLGALAAPGDLIVSDALNHASIVDGARLARARTAIVPHLDVLAVERALMTRGSPRAVVVTESYFSMDADSPDLRALRSVCDAHGAALVVDEAHALGILGPAGGGLCLEAGIQPDALIGTFGKSFGAAGAFVAGCPSLITWLWNRARTFVFSTGMSPAIASAARAGIRTASQEPERRRRVLEAASELRAGLAALGIKAAGFGPIVPWIVGDPATAVRIASALRGEGVDVGAIRPPSVPGGTARLRFTVTAAHGKADVAHALDVLGAVLRRDAR